MRTTRVCVGLQEVYRKNEQKSKNNQKLELTASFELVTVIPNPIILDTAVSILLGISLSLSSALALSLCLPSTMPARLHHPGQPTSNTTTPFSNLQWSLAVAVSFSATRTTNRPRNQPTGNTTGSTTWSFASTINDTVFPEPKKFHLLQFKLTLPSNNLVLCVLSLVDQRIAP